MRRFNCAALAAVAVIGFASVACAADMPTKAPIAVPFFSWTGFYAGLNAGYGWSSGNVDVTSLPSPAAFNQDPFSMTARAKGFIGGGQLGYNWQNGVWVFGIEADIDYAHISGDGLHNPNLVFGGANTFPTSFTTAHQELNWLATIRGRVGYAMDRVLFYGTGGLAVGGVKVSAFADNFPGAPGLQFAGSDSTTKTGWTAGGGIEWAFANRWSAKAEYLHYDLGSDTVTMARTSAGPAGFFVVSTFHISGDIVRVGANYKF
jgi:outer membrane immunogenic protein